MKSDSSPLELTTTWCRRLVVFGLLVLSTSAWAQQPVVTENPDGSVTVAPANPAGQGGQVAADPSRASEVSLDFGPDTSIYDLIMYFAPIRRLNFVISDVKELQGKKVTIVSNRSVPGDAAWEAFLSALKASGYSLTITGNTARVISAPEYAINPGRIGRGAPGLSDGYVTQLIQLENTKVDDMLKVISGMVPPEAKIIAYAPTNTLIITDTAANIRKLYKIMNELDVAAPRSTMEIYPIIHADSTEVKELIEQLYLDSGESSEPEPTTRARRRTTRASRRTSSRSTTRAPSAAEGVSAGDQAKYISKVLNDERTNSLIVLANQDGHGAVRALIKKIDVDTDGSASDQIHVLMLENAKADEVAQIMQQLAQDSGGGGDDRTAAARRAAAAARRGQNQNQGNQDQGRAGSAVAAFDSGMRIAADENTNALIIIANNDDYRVIRSVVKQLDIERKQVFVDAVVLELSSEDSANLGLAYHAPMNPSDTSVGFVGSQLGGSTSLGLSQDALSGLAFGVFGDGVEVPILDPTTGLATTINVPAFGIALNAIRTSGSTNIISNPTLMTLDNQEAEIVVGRKIPFPTSSGLNSLGSPVVSFQREDVAITLKITPRINSSNYVTLELEVEVQEVEESAQSAQTTAAGGGFITSQRRLQTVALVRDNQTMVIGGLVGSTEGKSESKVPILGDLPLVGALFRARSSTERKTNMMIFITPHIIEDPDDMLEIQRVKEAQRVEFLRRFYGRSQDDFYAELRDFLRYSMNFVDEPTMYRGPTDVSQDLELSDTTRTSIEAVIDDARTPTPGDGAGNLPDTDDLVIEDGSDGGDNADEE